MIDNTFKGPPNDQRPRVGDASRSIESKHEMFDLLRLLQDKAKTGAGTNYALTICARLSNTDTRKWADPTLSETL